MIASATYEDWCALTEGTQDGDAEDLSEHQANIASLLASEPLGGGDMQVTAEDMGVGDHDGDDGERLVVCETEELEDRLSRLSDIDRATVAGNALASCSDDHGLITVLEWLCKVGPDARAVVAREALGLVAHGLRNDHGAILDLFTAVSPDALGKVLQQLPVGVE